MANTANAASSDAKNKNFQEYIYPVIVLAAIAFCATLLLAITNAITTSVIEQNNFKRANEARRAVLASGDEFEPVEGLTADQLLTSADGSAYIADVKDVTRATNGSGYAITVHNASFGGDLTLMVGVDASGACTGVQVTEHSDTPGVGTKDQDPEYLSQYVGMNDLESPDDVKKEPDFEYISGASVSGAAIHEAVDVALDQVRALGGAQ